MMMYIIEHEQETNTYVFRKGDYRVEVSATDYNLWQDGTLIQYAMPDLTPEQREFIITGTTPDEWARLVGEE